MLVCRNKISICVTSIRPTVTLKLFLAIDKFDYQPHYGTDFGGVTAITPKQYRKANGHSNQFWGWGGEDNDMEFRIRRK